MKTLGRLVSGSALFAGTVALLSALSGAASAGTPINKLTTASPSGDVEISNTVGSVVVTGWNRNEVAVTGELGEGAERVEFTRSGDVIRIKVVVPERSFHGDDTDLIVKMPAGNGVSVNTVSADVSINGVRGAQRLQAVSGDVRTEGAGEDVECRTVSGDVVVNGSGRKGVITITTVSGDAVVERVAGELNANTVSGNVTLGAGETSRSRLRSTSGDLHMSGQLLPDARIDAETISGDVRLDLAGLVNGEFDVSTFNGEIRNCFGPKPTRTSEYAPGSELRFRDGNGSSRVRIKTLNGDINVCRK
jgi:hypothetical protein